MTFCDVPNYSMYSLTFMSNGLTFEIFNIILMFLQMLGHDLELAFLKISWIQIWQRNQ